MSFYMFFFFFEISLIMFCAVYITSYQRFASKIHQFMYYKSYELPFLTIFTHFQLFSLVFNRTWSKPVLAGCGCRLPIFRPKNWTGPDLQTLFRGKNYIPQNNKLQQQIVEMFHGHETAGHPGKLETFNTVQQYYWWPGLWTFIKNYVKGCSVCQQFKIDCNPSKPAWRSEIHSTIRKLFDGSNHRPTTIWRIRFDIGRGRPRPYKWGNSPSLQQNDHCRRNSQTSTQKFIQNIWLTRQNYLGSRTPIHIKDVHRTVETTRNKIGIIHGLSSTNQRRHGTSKPRNRSLLINLLHFT